MDVTQFKHKLPIQVRFVDIDKFGHVNNAVFHSYFEMARVAYFDQILGTRIDWQKNGMILARSVVDFKIPVRMSDTIYCYTRVSKLGNKSFELSNVLVKEVNGEEIITTIGTGIIVCINYETEETIAIPDAWRAALIAFEDSTLS